MLLLLGTLSTLGVAIRFGIARGALTLSGKIGIGLVLFVTAYQTILLIFPYLRYWPSLFGL